MKPGQLRLVPVADAYREAFAYDELYGVVNHEEAMLGMVARRGSDWVAAPGGIASRALGTFETRAAALIALVAAAAPKEKEQME